MILFYLKENLNMKKAIIKTKSNLNYFKITLIKNKLKLMKDKYFIIIIHIEKLKSKQKLKLILNILFI